MIDMKLVAGIRNANTLSLRFPQHSNDIRVNDVATLYHILAPIRYRTVTRTSPITDRVMTSPKTCC